MLLTDNWVWLQSGAPYAKSDHGAFNEGNNWTRCTHTNIYCILSSNMVKQFFVPLSI